MALTTSSPTDPADQFTQRLALMDRRIADLERAASRTGLFGFAVRRNVNEAARGTLQAFDLGFDTCVHNNGFLGGAVVPGAITPQAVFTVPAGGAGVYMLNSSAFWSVNLAGIALAIGVNSLAVVASPNLGTVTTAQSYDIGRAYRLAVGDTIRATMYNGSAGNITVATTAANGVVVATPYLSAWRITS